MHDRHTGMTHAAAAKDPMANTKDAMPSLYIHAFRMLAHSPNAFFSSDSTTQLSTSAIMPSMSCYFDG